MGLLNKLFGSDDAEKAAKDLLKGVVQTVKNEVGTSSAGTSDTQRTAAAPAAASTAPSGFSWGEEMPAEENQYSFSGGYLAYFEQLYRTQYPAYRIETAAVSPRSTTLTFWQGDTKALVVELMSEQSSAKKLRTDCQKAGIPYLRFYYDHHGWWNTKSYVIERTNRALGC